MQPLRPNVGPRDGGGQVARAGGGSHISWSVLCFCLFVVVFKFVCGLCLFVFRIIFFSIMIITCLSIIV